MMKLPNASSSAERTLSHMTLRRLGARPATYDSASLREAEQQALEDEMRRAAIKAKEKSQPVLHEEITLQGWRERIRRLGSGWCG
jgi:hypothetical protein